MTRKKKKKGDNRHANRLAPSDPLGNMDIPLLCTAVTQRWVEVFDLYKRVNDTELILPVDMASDVMLWRRMAVRHKRDDFRHTESEYIALKNIAQWTLDMKCELTGRERQVLVWKD